MALDFLSSLGERDDHSLLGGIVSLLGRAGIEVEGYMDILSDLLAKNGMIACREPNSLESEDIAYGMGIANRLLPLSFGQSIVVCGKAVVAVEAMEGTDETIKRAGVISHAGVLIKMMRADQDIRYDIPVVGPRTLELMTRGGLTCLALPAGRALVISPEEFDEIARAGNISVIGMNG
jgi:DUF1009 family protein